MRKKRDVATVIGTNPLGPFERIVEEEINKPSKPEHGELQRGRHFMHKSRPGEFRVTSVCQGRVYYHPFEGRDDTGQALLGRMYVSSASVFQADELKEWISEQKV